MVGCKNFMFQINVTSMNYSEHIEVIFWISTIYLCKNNLAISYLLKENVIGHLMFAVLACRVVGCSNNHIWCSGQLLLLSWD